ncbi:MAG: histidine phosphatase family protein, partial [Planctomycetota bacterium]
MDIYLVQHAQALTEDQNPQRPLSDQGRRMTTNIAQYLAKKAEKLIDPPISAVYHSPKLRTQQTAAIIAQAIDATPSELDNLKPNDDPNIIYHQLMADRDQTNAIMVVGHLPHLARLTGLLLC